MRAYAILEGEDMLDVLYEPVQADAWCVRPTFDDDSTVPECFGIAVSVGDEYRDIKYEITLDENDCVNIFRRYISMLVDAANRKQFTYDGTQPPIETTGPYGPELRRDIDWNLVPLEEDDEDCCCPLC
jgi:hypothetical protein